MVFGSITRERQEDSCCCLSDSVMLDRCHRSLLVSASRPQCGLWNPAHKFSRQKERDRMMLAMSVFPCVCFRILLFHGSELGYMTVVSTNDSEKYETWVV